MVDLNKLTTSVDNLAVAVNKAVDTLNSGGAQQPAVDALQAKVDAQTAALAAATPTPTPAA